MKVSTLLYSLTLIFAVLDTVYATPRQQQLAVSGGGTDNNDALVEHGMYQGLKGSLRGVRTTRLVAKRKLKGKKGVKGKKGTKVKKGVKVSGKKSKNKGRTIDTGIVTGIDAGIDAGVGTGAVVEIDGEIKQVLNTEGPTISNTISPNSTKAPRSSTKAPSSSTKSPSSTTKPRSRMY